jgi:hypothetical protein
MPRGGCAHCAARSPCAGNRGRGRVVADAQQDGRQGAFKLTPEPTDPVKSQVCFRLELARGQLPRNNLLRSAFQLDHVQNSKTQRKCCVSHVRCPAGAPHRYCAFLILLLLDYRQSTILETEKILGLAIGRLVSAIMTRRWMISGEIFLSF